MGYKIMQFGSALGIILNKIGVDIRALALDGEGNVPIELSFVGRRGEALTKLVLAETGKLAEKLDITAPELDTSTGQTSLIRLKWLPKTLSREQFVVELAKLFDSKEFAKALDQLG